MISSAGEMMTTKVISVGPDDNIEKAVKILAEHNISGLPVVDENNKVVGIISSSDIVKFSGKLHVVPLIASSGWVSPYTDVSAMNSYSKGHELLTSRKVRDIMTKKVTTVQESASGEEVARIISKKKINRLPVTDNNGKLVGIITRSDLIDSLAKDTPI
ncbi:MAG: CBS domain-containing protein [Peptococcia bacterium]